MDIVTKISLLFVLHYGGTLAQSLMTANGSTSPGLLTTLPKLTGECYLSFLIMYYRLEPEIRLVMEIIVRSAYTNWNIKVNCLNQSLVNLNTIDTASITLHHFVHESTVVIDRDIFS